MNDFAAGLDPYEDLPEEPEEAFLKLEAHFAVYALGGSKQRPKTIGSKCSISTTSSK